MKRICKEGSSWIDFIVYGLDFILDVIGITTPMNQLEEKLSEMEEYYWMRVIYDEYIKIFPDPYGLSNPGNERKFAIRTMRDKLNSHGYTFEYGTPLDFIRFLRNRGTCERPYCERDDL